MTDTPINVERSERLKAVMDRWIKFTGVAVDQKRFSIKMDGSPGSMDVHRNYRRVKEATELDESGILPVACFRSFFYRYLDHLTISATEMLDPDEFKKSMDQMSELQAIKVEVEDPIFTEPVEGLQESIRQAAEHYECDVAAVRKAVADETALEEAMFMAFKGTESMPEEWFSKGEYDKEPPQLCKTILSFDNDLQAISFAAQMPVPLIALGIVYDEYNPLFSHFMFLCKSGENVWMLHDKTEWKHPAQEELISGRRGGIRMFESDKEFAWQFPYHLLESLKKKDTIVSDVPISKLEPNNVAWLIMVFERIRLKYFEGKYEPKKLMAIISDLPPASPAPCRSGSSGEPARRVCRQAGYPPRTPCPHQPCTLPYRM